MTLPSSTCNLAPTGKLSPSGNCTSRIGAWVSRGTRMLTSTISCPVLVRTAVCSIAHSSGASRLALVQRAIQPGCGAAPAAGVSAGDPGGASLLCAACGADLDLGAAWAWPDDPRAARATTTASLAKIFTEPA